MQSPYYHIFANASIKRHDERAVWLKGWDMPVVIW